MPLNTETFEADIVINSKQALSELKKLKEMRDNEIKSQEALYRTGKKEDRELAAQKQKNIEHYNKMIREQEKYIKGLSRSVNQLSNASYKELSEIYRALNKELRSGNVERNSKEWNELTQKIRACRTEMKKIESATQAQTSVWQRFSKFLNDSWGGLTLVIGSLTGLSMTVRKAVQDFADMEEAMADTRKYTGLADEQVRDLNEEFKKMDTRTSREELNELAGVAGRLGKTSKEDIMDFVEAGNMIKVALGDDLGEGAIDKIGKLAMAFGEDDKSGLRGAMLATGSAVNELAQNSAAKAGYLVDFTARVGAFGRQLGLTQAQLMGFAAVMDEGMLRDEMAATAFGNMLTRMRTDTEKFAKIAGMDIKEFARLLDEDANAALLRLADNMKRQDAQTMMKMLDDMGLDGSRAVAVISTLADKIDDVRRHQQLATKAYDEATSVVQEYTVMNATAQAELDKAKKAFHELTVELGERLKPVVTYTVSIGGLVVKLLVELTKFCEKYKNTLTVLTAAIIAYTVAVNAQTAAAKIQVFWNEKVVASFRLLYRVLISHPYLAVATAIASLVAMMVDLTRKTDSARQSIKALNDINKQASLEAESETRQLQQLVDIARDKASSDQQRAAAIKQINEISPEYLGNLTAENIGTREADAAIQNYTKSILLNAKAKRLAAQIDEIEQKKQEKRNKLDSGEYYNWYDPWVAVWNSAAEKLDRTTNAIGSFVTHGNLKGWDETSATPENGYYTDVASMSIARYREEVKKLDEQQAMLNKTLEETTKELMAVSSASDKDEKPDPYAGGGGSTTSDDPYKTDLKALEENQKQALYTLRLNHEKGLMADEDYYKAVYKTEMQFLQQKLELEEKYGKSQIDTQNDILTRMSAEATRLWQEDQKNLKSELDLADAAYKADQTALKELFLRGDIATEEDYNERKLEAERDYYQQRLAIIQKYGGDTLDAESSIANSRFNQFVEDRKKRKKELEEQYNEADTFGSQEMILQTMYAQGLINFEEYQQRKIEISEKAAEQQKRINDQLYREIGSTMQAVSNMFSQMQQAEVSSVEERYEKQIQAARKAGRNTTKLEKQKEKEIAAIKTKYADREFQMKVLEIVADTAVGIAKLWKNPGYPWAIPLTALVAAQGAMQLATAKKAQQQAQKGYYEGGYTGGRRYRREAGVVHEGEFVANHEAVNNPAVTPFLDFIDRAQRNNTVGSLTMDDVRRAIGGGQTQVVAPVVNVQTDNEELREVLDANREANEQLAEQLKKPIKSYVVLTGPDGLNAQQERLDRMLKNK